MAAASFSIILSLNDFCFIGITNERDQLRKKLELMQSMGYEVSITELQSQIESLNKETHTHITVIEGLNAELKSLQAQT